MRTLAIVIDDTGSMGSTSADLTCAINYWLKINEIQIIENTMKSGRQVDSSKNGCCLGCSTFLRHMITSLEVKHLSNYSVYRVKMLFLETAFSLC